MSRRFGWDLPPGVSASDIPGNRPEDEKWDAIIDDFFGKERSEERKKILADASEELTNLIIEALEYGIELGKKEQQAIEQENKS